MDLSLRLISKRTNCAPERSYCDRSALSTKAVAARSLLKVGILFFISLAGGVSRKGLLRRSDCLFESLPNEPRIRDTTRLGPRLHCGEQRLRHAHVDLFLLLLEFKPHLLELLKIQIRKISRQ